MEKKRETLVLFIKARSHDYIFDGDNHHSLAEYISLRNTNTGCFQQLGQSSSTDLDHGISKGGRSWEVQDITFSDIRSSHNVLTP